MKMAQAKATPIADIEVSVRIGANADRRIRPGAVAESFPVRSF